MDKKCKKAPEERARQAFGPVRASLRGGRGHRRSERLAKSVARRGTEFGFFFAETESPGGQRRVAGARVGRPESPGYSKCVGKWVEKGARRKPRPEGHVRPTYFALQVRCEGPVVPSLRVQKGPSGSDNDFSPGERRIVSIGRTGRRCPRAVSVSAFSRVSKLFRPDPGEGMECHSGSDGESSGDDEDAFDFSFLEPEEVGGQLERAATAGVAGDVRTLLLHRSSLAAVPPLLDRFKSLKYLDLSSNHLSVLPAELCRCPLTTLIAKNNRLSNKSLPSTFGNLGRLRELNFSGNEFSYFPPEILEMRSIHFLYMGGNKISTIPREIKNLNSLQVLSLGSNNLKEVPCSLGQLRKLTALILSDNQLESLPREIAELKNLKSLLLHKNRLRTLPTEIASLKCMTELSLRDNPLVVRFVSDMTHEVPSLLELAARCLKLHSVSTPPELLPPRLADYLGTAHHCINPKCKGVFFDSRVEHVKFVDFCGKYRVPLLQYLCSSSCIDDKDEVEVDSDLMKKVLLG